MRKWSTSLLLGGLALVGLLAAVDAIRGIGTGAREPAPTATRPPRSTTPARDLERAGVSGLLYFTVRSGDGCRLTALELPTLSEEHRLVLDGCRFQVAPRERSVASFSPCPGGRIEIWRLIRPSLRTSFDGCAPAWKPDGQFTFVRGGEVVSPFTLECIGTGPRADCGFRTLLLQRDVERELAAVSPSQARWPIRELAWLTDSRMVAIVRRLRPFVNDFVAVFEGREFVGAPNIFGFLSHLRVGLAAQEILTRERYGGFAVFDRDGQWLGGRSPADARSVAPSPDGAFRAVARPGNICIYRAGEDRFPVACIRFNAVDVAWQ